MCPDRLSVKVQLLAWLSSLLVVALLSFAVTWTFFETLGTWRWP